MTQREPTLKRPLVHKQIKKLVERQKELTKFLHWPTIRDTLSDGAKAAYAKEYEQNEGLLRELREEHNAIKRAR